MEFLAWVLLYWVVAFGVNVALKVFTTWAFEDGRFMFMIWFLWPLGVPCAILIELLIYITLIFSRLSDQAAQAIRKQLGKKQ